jgi:hypothetical protein
MTADKVTPYTIIVPTSGKLFRAWVIEPERVESEQEARVL